MISEGGRREWRAHWPTVLASAVGMSFATLYVYSAGALIEPIEKEFGWSRAAIGSGLTVLTATGALLGPAMGIAVDRIGPRRLAVPGVVAFCAAFALLSQAHTLWTWWALWGLLAVCGIGVKPAVWTTAIASLFARSRGLALAVTLSGTSIGSIFTPLITNRLIESHGWRGAFVGLALVWGVIGFPIIYLFFRGASDKQRAGTMAVAARAHGLSVRASILSWRYVALVAAAMCFSFLSMSLIVSLIPIMSSHGVPRDTAAQIAATIGLTAIIGRLGTGFLLDRFDPRVTTAIAMALPIVTFTLLLTTPHSIPFAYVAVLMMGLSLGAEVDAVAFLTGHYFGMRNYGLLFGTMMSGLSIATGAAPLVAGAIYDWTGSYNLMLMGAIPLCLISAALILTLGRPPDLGGETSTA